MLKYIDTTMLGYIDTTMLLNVTISLIVLVVGVLVSKHVKKLLLKYLGEYDSTVAELLSRMLYVACLVLVAVLVLAQLGLPISPLTGVLTGIVFGVSLSLKSSYAILASGIMIAFSKPFEIGQKVDIGGAAGTVLSVGFMYTRLIADDGNVVVLANNMVLSRVVTIFEPKEDEVVSE
jgi:small conductance mechanosensitive channel